MAPQQATINNREAQTNASRMVVAEPIKTNLFIANLMVKPKRLSAAADDSPPPFIRHHALRI
jgi:hypothetical protein